MSIDKESSYIFEDMWSYEVNDGLNIVTEDRDISRQLLEVDRLIEDFNIDNVSFQLPCGNKVSDGELVYRKVMGSLSERLFLKNKLIDNFFYHYSLIKSYKSRGLLSVRAFSPNITAYLQWMDQVDRSVAEFDKLNEIRGAGHKSLYRPNYQDLEQKIYKCFVELSEKLNHPGFKKLKLKTKKSCDKNYRSMLSYIDRLFEKRARLLFVRVDLGYSKKHNSNMRKTKIINKDPKKAAEEFEQVKSDIERLLNNRRHNKIFDGLLGYIWKLEYGVMRGYHYHVLLVFNSSKHCHDVNIGERVGEYWKKAITPERGEYFNVNGSKGRYRYNALGQVHQTDHDGRKGLDHIVKYFSKADYFMRLELPKRLRGKKTSLYRTLGKGQLSKTKSNRGRPRVKK